MHEYIHSRPETDAERQLTILTDEAFGLIPTYEKSDEAIWQALSNFNIRERAERIRLFKLIKARIQKRKKQEQQKAEEEHEWKDFLREESIRDAHAHQMRQPRDAWDNSYDPDEEQKKLD